MFSLLLNATIEADAGMPTDVLVGWVVILLFFGGLAYLCVASDSQYADTDADYTDDCADAEHTQDAQEAQRGVEIYANGKRIVGGFKHAKEAQAYLDSEVGVFNAIQLAECDDAGEVWEKRKVARAIGNKYVVETWRTSPSNSICEDKTEYEMR